MTFCKIAPYINSLTYLLTYMFLCYVCCSGFLETMWVTFLWLNDFDILIHTHTHTHTHTQYIRYYCVGVEDILMSIVHLSACLSVCPISYLRNFMAQFYQILRACWYGPPLLVLCYIHYVLLVFWTVWRFPIICSSVATFLVPAYPNCCGKYFVKWMLLIFKSIKHKVHPMTVECSSGAGICGKFFFT